LIDDDYVDDDDDFGDDYFDICLQDSAELTQVAVSGPDVMPIVAERSQMSASGYQGARQTQKESGV
jgi:hypothetical protein